MLTQSQPPHPNILVISEDCKSLTADWDAIAKIAYDVQHLKAGQDVAIWQLLALVAWLAKTDRDVLHG